MNTACLVGCTVLLCVAAPKAAATLGLAYPPQATHYLAFASSSSQGSVGYNESVKTPGAGDGKGHYITSSNVYPSGSVAYYYITGSERSPQAVTSDATAQLSAAIGFSNFNAAVATHGLVLSDFKFRYGQTGSDYTKTWNLGPDTLGQRYWLSSVSTVEERIYRAQPNEVEMLITYAGAPWVRFSYSPIFLIIDYAGFDPFDDVIQSFSNPMTASAAPGLSGDALAAAEALLEDIRANGGHVQARFDAVTPAIQQTFTGGYEGANFTFGGIFQVVPAPTLAIAPHTNGAIVTWTASWNGYLLETSTAADGPWTTVATSTNEVVVSIDQNTRFYRLNTKY